MERILWVGVSFHPNDSDTPSARSQQTAIRGAVAGWVICNKVPTEASWVEPIKARLSIYHRSEGRVIMLTDIAGKLFGFGILVSTVSEATAKIPEVSHWLRHLGVVSEPTILGWDPHRGIHFAGQTLLQHPA